MVFILVAIIDLWARQRNNAGADRDISSWGTPDRSSNRLRSLISERASLSSYRRPVSDGG